MTSVDAFVVRCGAVTFRNLDRLVAQWHQTLDQDWYRASEAVRQHVISSGRGGVWWDARKRAKVAAKRSVWQECGDAAVKRSGEWGAAWQAIRDAAGAVVVRDLISTDDFGILVGPWEKVVCSIDDLKESDDA